jgi:fructokinase
LIIVCGEALIDVIRNDDGTQQATPGGGPFNSARALARLGVPTAFLGHLSTDEFGRELAGLLKDDGVSLQYATFGPEKTTIAVANVDSDGLAEYEFLVHGTSAPNLTPEMLPSDFGPAASAIYLGTLGLVLEPMAQTLEALADREHGKRLLMLDPNIRVGLTPESDYRERLHHVIAMSSLVKASDADLSWLYPGLEYTRAAERILDQGVSAVVVTLGADGAFGAHRDVRIRVPAPQVRVVDTIGAGDAFGAALLAWLHAHDCISPELHLGENELREALEYACLAAAITCTRAGADPPRAWELVPA